MTHDAITAAAAGTWTLGDLTVNRIGFGAMRLTGNADGTPGDRGRAVAGGPPTMERPRAIAS